MAKTISGQDLSNGTLPTFAAQAISTPNGEVQVVATYPIVGNCPDGEEFIVDGSSGEILPADTDRDEILITMIDGDDRIRLGPVGVAIDSGWIPLELGQQTTISRPRSIEALHGISEGADATLLISVVD